MHSARAETDHADRASLAELSVVHALDIMKKTDDSGTRGQTLLGSGQENSVDGEGVWSYQLVLPMTAHLTSPQAPSPVPTDDAEPTSTAIDQVFERLLADIVRGAWPAGTRLPAERELSRQLGASRPTLREALRRLGEWNLVEPRRGSGIVVRGYRDWSIEVIAAYLRYGKPMPGQPSLARIVIDMFEMRRGMVLDVIRMTAPRIPAGGLKRARLAMARAWAMRNDPSYVREDFEVMREIVEAAGFTPGLWLLNRIATIWTDAAASLRFAVRAPDDYVATHTKFFELLESGDSEGAVALMKSYLERHDDHIVRALQVIA